MFNRQLCWDLSAAVAETNSLLTEKKEEQDPNFSFASIGITSTDPFDLTLADLQKEATYQHFEDFGYVAFWYQNDPNVGGGEARTLAGSAYG